MAAADHRRMQTSTCFLMMIMMAMMMMMASWGTAAAAARDQRYCGRCHRTLQCPANCPHFNDGKAASLCVINCNSCSARCKKNGAICTDPRFVGGDGAIFYFHGKANDDFCIVSDNALHINGHFIGKRPIGRSRDFTWVQSIGILYGRHKVSVGAKKVALWDDATDQLDISYDGMSITLDTMVGESWLSPLGEFKAIRTDAVNSIELEVTNLLKVSINVTYVNEEDSRIHNYEINGQDCFAHLDLHFSFFNLSTEVAGVLGQTYNKGYISPVKHGVPMPIMGGYNKFKSSSLLSTDCEVARFDPSAISEDPMGSGAPRDFLEMMPSMSCTSQGENGIVCRR